MNRQQQQQQRLHDMIQASYLPNSTYINSVLSFHWQLPHTLIPQQRWVTRSISGVKLQSYPLNLNRKTFSVQNCGIGITIRQPTKIVLHENYSWLGLVWFGLVWFSFITFGVLDFVVWVNKSTPTLFHTYIYFAWFRSSPCTTCKHANMLAIKMGTNTIYGLLLRSIQTAWIIRSAEWVIQCKQQQLSIIL